MEEAKLGKTLLQNFLGTLDNTGFGGRGLGPIDTVEVPQVSSPNYTPLYIVAAIAVLGVFFIILNMKK